MNCKQVLGFAPPDAVCLGVETVLDYYSKWFHIPASSYSSFFPHNADMAEVDKLQMAGDFPSLDVLIPVSCAVAFLLGMLRLLANKFVFYPLCRSGMKLEEKIELFTRYPDIDRSFQTRVSKKKKISSYVPSSSQLEKICIDTGRSVQVVKSYLSLVRRASKQKKQCFKFAEAGYRFVIYTFLTAFGMHTLLRPGGYKDWVHIPENQWVDFLHQNNARMADVQWYYFLEFGLYIQFMVSQFFDNKRADFWEMFVHHLATAFLILFSYVTNYIRVGTLVMLTHDVADVFLELAKLFNYCKDARPWTGNVADGIFVVFALTFLLSRLVYFPLYILRSTSKVALETIPFYCGFYIFNIPLWILLCLHIFWMYLIIKMAYRLMVVGTVEKDIRSDEEGEEGDVDGGKGKEKSTGGISGSGKGKDD